MWFLSRSRGNWRARAVGLLVGTAAATAGVLPVLGPLRPSHLLVIVALVLALSSPGTLRWSNIRPGVLDVAFVVVIVVGTGIDLFNAGQLRFEPAFSVSTAAVWYLGAFVAARLVVHDIVDLDDLLTGLALPGIFAALAAIGQAFAPGTFGWVTVAAPSASYDLHVAEGDLPRATWFIGHWTGGAYYGCAVITVLATILILRRKQPGSQGALVVASIVVMGGVFASATLAPLLTGLFLLLVGWLLSGYRWSHLIAYACSLPAISWILGNGIVIRVEEQGQNNPTTPGVPEAAPNTIAYRIHVWLTETLPAIRQRPWTGWGTEVYSSTEPGRVLPDSIGWGSAESQWLWAAICFGIPFAMLFVAFIIITGCIIGRRLLGEGRLIVVPIALLYLFAVLGAFLVPVFTNRGFPLAFWPVLAAVMAIAPPRSRRAGGNG